MSSIACGSEEIGLRKVREAQSEKDRDYDEEGIGEEVAKGEEEEREEVGKGEWVGE